MGGDPAWVIRSCTLAEMDELLDMLDKAFEKKERHWFVRFRPQIFQRTEASVRCHRIVTDRKGVAGCVGIYPLELRVGRAVLSVGGVGSVAVREDVRGCGLMSAMLRQAVSVMENEGYDISWLGGIRFRYSHFGWDFGGRHMCYAINRSNIRRWQPELSSCSIRRVRFDDIPALQKLYAGLGGGVIRRRDQWPVLLNHAEYVWEITEDRRAYLAAMSSAPENVAEVAGAPDRVAPLLEAHARRWKRTWIRVNVPQGAGTLNRALFRFADDFSVHHNHQIQIVNVTSTWKKLAPEIVSQAGAAGHRRAEEIARVCGVRDQSLILRRALGFMDSVPALPGRLRRFEWVKPLGWWMSSVDGV